MVYGPEYGQPETIHLHAPEYDQPEINLLLLWESMVDLFLPERETREEFLRIFSVNPPTDLIPQLNGQVKLSLN